MQKSYTGMNAIVSNIVLVVAMILTGCGASDGRRNETKVQQASQTTQLKMKFRADSAYENIRQIGRASCRERV